ncbi:site-specific integrase [Lachnospiraceae bacterium BX10]|uniref:Site-specific integrase n=1 Tax=Enterocloster hominis (ex Liu et al. 2021) TaxID=2763663 RepID=A0ABR7NUC8_9FIRM|nr:site-specific integrase [Enterocloster hominis]MBC8599514.1 site-specific integrase [Enterocloster hominis]
MEEKETTKKRRKKGAGSIMRKANGTYLGRIAISGYEPFSCTGATKKEVERKLEEFKIRTLKKEVIPQKIFVNTYIEKWMETVKRPSLKAASFDRLERTYLTQIKDSRVGRCQLGNITSMDVQGLINEKSRTLSYSSLKKIYELLNGCFEYAVICREMDFNPVRAVQMPKKENLNKKEKQMGVFSKEELTRIENVAAITYQSGEVRYRHTWFFLLLANTGLRAGEAIALRWDNIDLDKGFIHVKQNASVVKCRDGKENKYQVVITTVKTKTGNRIVPCNEKALQALRALQDYQKSHHIHSDYVDCNDKGELLSQQTLPKILKAILKAADVPYRSVHSFRHTFATNLIQAGVDVKVVSQLLGHSSVKITYDTYVHMGVDRAIEAVKRIG